jgi:glycosyltransferase involved in cell wall biosynthesis/GT2 family glycosyltransferase
MINSLEPDFSDLPGRRPIPRHYKRDIATDHHVDVSIITPYYNTEDFFAETFVSLLAQSLQNWEWVILDDGSTDEESVKRLTAIAARDKRIRAVRQTNAGPGAARNSAFRNTSGRYVCLLDSDDMLEPTYLEKCVWFLDSNPEFAFCNAYSVLFGDRELLLAAGFEKGKVHLKKNIGPPISVIRRTAYEDCGGFDESIRFGHEDWDFWLAMAKAGHWGYTIQEYLQWYRKRADGRYEQIMKSGNANAEFEILIHRKYNDLDRHFPEPCRRPCQPYEDIKTDWLVNNPLAANPQGRRIMFIVPWMVAGGADRVNLDLIEGLTEKGHDVSICATLSTDHRWEDQFSRFTPDIFILPNFLHVSDYPRFMAYLIRSRQIDTVVMTGSTVGYHLLPYLRAVSPDVAFVDLCHVEEPHWLNGGHPRFGAGYQDLLELNIVTNRHLAEWMQNRGADGERIRVMYTGVRVSRNGNRDEVRRQVRSELNIPQEIPLIVFIGRICEQKRPALLADIFNAARNQGMPFRALIIGEGELKAQLENLLEEHRLADHVRMLPLVAHQRWLDILIASDLFLMPSRYEGISIALLESMTAGVVPIAAKVGGHDEIVPPDAGVLIPQGENELREYVDAIHGLISYPEKLHQMSKACKALAASKLSWEAMIDRFIGLIDEAHQLRIKQPRYPISLGFARELASLSLECKRLGETVDWLWSGNPRSAPADTKLLTSSPESRAVATAAVLLSQSRLGRMLIRSRFLKSMGKRILKRISSPKGGQ